MKRISNDKKSPTLFAAGSSHDAPVSQEDVVSDGASSPSECDSIKNAKPSSSHESLLTDEDRRDLDEIVNKNQGEKEKPPKRKAAGGDSFWLILFIVFGILLIGNQIFQTPRREIPIMKLVQLIEQGNPNRRGSAGSGATSLEMKKNVDNAKETADSPQTPSVDTLSTEPSPLALPALQVEATADKPSPSISVTEGTGKRRRIVVYSDLADLCLTPFEVTGTVTRHVLNDDPKKSKVTEKVPFFSGRQGLGDDDSDLFHRLEKAGFEEVRAQGPPNFMDKYGFFLISSILCLGVLFFFLQKIGSGAMAFGRNREILVAQEDVEVSFQDVAGVEEAVEELREIVDFLRTPEKFRALGGRIPKGVLLVGPPGTGKTLLAKAVAGEANVPFFSLSGSDFVEIYAGVGAARVRDLFKQAEKSSPSIVFIDELDALGRSRSGSSIGGAHDEREQTLNALLVEMDGFGTNSGTIVMAATNRPEILDSALLRSGRFDRQVLVDRPDIRGREEILKIHAKSVKLSPDLDLHQIASITSGFVGADLEALVNEAALLAARGGKDSVTLEEFTEAVERVTAGLQKRKRVITEAEKVRVSHHECGHALMARSLPNADPVHKISIIPRGIAALGYTLQRPDDERYLMTRSELEDRIRILLAGTAAEEIIFSDISTGAQNDLERATELARNMVMSFGMSRLGRISYRKNLPSWTGDYGGTVREFSEKTAWEIDQEIKSIIDRLYRETVETLTEKRELLERLSERLLEKEVLDATELDEVIAVP